MLRFRIILSGLCLLLPLYVGAIDLPCDTESHPQVCAFLNRYINELSQWSEPNVSLFQKMRDDKFVILDGSIDALSSCTDSTSFSLVRYDNKAYEATWNNGNDTLLHVAFPIQYELILGMPQVEIEQNLQDYIVSAHQREKAEYSNITFDSIAPNVYRSTPRQHYQLPALNNSRYFCKLSNDSINLIYDTALVEYSIANLFQDGIEKEYLMQVSQGVYGFRRLNYTISLQQWLNYCEAERLTCYVAIEEETADAIQVLIVAENIDLAYNHLLSVLVPRDVLSKDNGTLLVKLNAFIPTHNITDLYEQYKSTPKKQREWIRN